MNERIKELIDEATTIHYGVIVDFDKEKFAELIVRECMEVARDYDGCKLSGPGMLIANDIEEHFGVEDERKD